MLRPTRREPGGSGGPAGPAVGADRGLREDAVWSDLAALTPPLVVCVAVLIGVAMLLRSQMSPKRRAERDERRRSPDQRS